MSASAAVLTASTLPSFWKDVAWTEKFARWVFSFRGNGIVHRPVASAGRLAVRPMKLRWPFFASLLKDACLCFGSSATLCVDVYS